MDILEIIDSFPETEDARLTAINTLARFWRKKFPEFEVRTRVPLREVALEPDEQELKQTWREEVLDVAVIIHSKVEFFQVLREDPEQTKKVLESISRVIRPEV
ncbi:hypothetical protein ES702_06924 [subsurface metagenome]